MSSEQDQISDGPLARTPNFKNNTVFVNRRAGRRVSNKIDCKMER